MPRSLGYLGAVGVPGPVNPARICNGAYPRKIRLPSLNVSTKSFTDAWRRVVLFAIQSSGNLRPLLTSGKQHCLHELMQLSSYPMGSLSVKRMRQRLEL